MASCQCQSLCASANPLLCCGPTTEWIGMKFCTDAHGPRWSQSCLLVSSDPRKETQILSKMFGPKSTWLLKIAFPKMCFGVLSLVWSLLLAVDLETPANMLWSQKLEVGIQSICAGLSFKQKTLNNTYKSWCDVKDFCCLLHTDYIHHVLLSRLCWHHVCVTSATWWIPFPMETACQDER